jgi:peptide/nickel transport system substrate-binding protein
LQQGGMIQVKWFTGRSGQGILRRSAVLAAVTMLLVAGCGGGKPSVPSQGPSPATPSAPQASGRTGPVVVVQGSEPTSLDASMQTGLLNLNPALHIMEPLVARDDQMQIVPALAESWKWVDATTLQLTLRQGVKFHDGSPFTAEDVKFTFDRIQDKSAGSEHARYFDGKSVESLAILDAKTVEFKLVKPYAPFLTHMTLVGIASKAASAELGDDYGKKPVGTGPYTFKEWTPGVRIAMVANEKYWGDKPQIAEIHFQAIKEESTRVAELLAGKADIITGVPPSDIQRVQGAANLEVQTVEGLRNVWIAMNTKKEPFNDPLVRQALNHAVNVEEIIGAILEGNATRSAAVMGPQVFGFNPSLKPYAYDPQKAKELLAQAGYADGLTLKISTFQGRLVKDKEIVEAIAAQLGEVGIKAQVQLLDFEAVLNLVRTFDNSVDLLLWSNANNNLDANYNLSLNFYSKGRGLYWSDPQVDQLIEQGANSVGESDRLKAYHEALAQMHAQAPVLFLYNQHDLYGTTTELDWKPRADEVIYLARSSRK